MTRDSIEQLTLQVNYNLMEKQLGRLGKEALTQVAEITQYLG